MTRKRDSLRTIAEELGIQNVTDQRLEIILMIWSRFRDGMDSLKALNLSNVAPTFTIAKKGAAHVRQH